MADVREKVEQIRQAVYGKEVRESIASGIEAINTEVESTTQRQTTLETDMAEAKREAEEATTRANAAAGDAEDITEAMAIWEEYDPEKDYAPLNKVAYQGSSYINVLACKGVPPTEETHWLPIASKGDKGEPGPMPTIIVGDTTTLSPGSAASVTRRADSPDAAPVLDFGIPRGVDGTGSGDMSKIIYDDNDDGKVNAADIADRVPDGAITDDMLSDDPSHIKARLSSHMADYATFKSSTNTEIVEIKKKIGIVHNVESWEEVQAIVRAGLADQVFSVGDMLVSKYNGIPTIWIVIGINHDVAADGSMAYTMTIQTKDCLKNVQFDAAEPSNPDANRQQYGNNRYIHSSIKQWLNSDADVFNWVSQHEHDVISTTTGAGFLKLLDPELAAVIGAVNKQVARNTVTDGGGQDLFSDKVFLLSRVEAGFGAEGTVDGELVYPFYDGISDAGRIKLLSGSPRNWWLRSPHVGNSSHVRFVNTSGRLYYNYAHSEYGVSPACCII